MELRAIDSDTELSILEKNYPGLQNLVSVYPPELADKIIQNKEKLHKVIQAFASINAQHSANTIAMTCSLTCPYSNICVLIKADIAPIGYPCPIERKMLIELESDIIMSLKIDRSDPIEMEMLWDLLDTKILDMRTSAELRTGKVTSSVTLLAGKMQIQKEELNPSILLKIDLKKLKHNIIDTFVATRRAKKKYGLSGSVGGLEDIIKNAMNKNIDESDEN